MRKEASAGCAGADITQYFLGGYNVAKVQPGGKLVLLDTAAEKTPTALTVRANQA